MRQCSHCRRTSTPLWRRDPETQQTLCNACGIYVRQRHMRRPRALIDADREDDQEFEEAESPFGGRQCSHCRARETCVWRRNKEGDQVCNACGVFERLRGIPRPLSLQHRKIRARFRNRQMALPP
ncbi:hypothetical protein DFH07DRAFT_921522 [Mycena maculata]|uniref:GATA-type domain-containing protein n=1 Tax=Mycena maculata TaxID=230809 RepID=A0AAD7NA18_9AGAR|nr:hypothetical protein DFH07DRAFT_921522 [Mycena maculata]